MNTTVSKLSLQGLSSGFYQPLTHTHSSTTIYSSMFQRSLGPLFRISDYASFKIARSSFENNLGGSLVLESLSILYDRLEPCTFDSCSGQILVQDCKFVNISLMKSYACVYIDSIASNLNIVGCTFFKIDQGNEAACIFCTCPVLSVSRTCFIDIDATHLSSSGYGGVALAHRNNGNCSVSQSMLLNAPKDRRTYPHAAIYTTGEGDTLLKDMNATHGVTIYATTWVSYASLLKTGDPMVTRNLIRNYTGSHAMIMSTKYPNIFKLEDSILIDNDDMMFGLLQAFPTYLVISRCAFINNVYHIFKLGGSTTADVVDCVFSPEFSSEMYLGSKTARNVHVLPDHPNNYPNLEGIGVELAVCTYGFPSFMFSSSLGKIGIEVHILTLLAHLINV